MDDVTVSKGLVPSFTVLEEKPVESVSLVEALENLKDITAIKLDDSVNLNFTPGARALYEAMEAQMDTIFDHALDRLAKVRQACDEAEQALKTRKAAAKDSVGGFIHSVQEVEKQSDSMQKVIGEVLVATSRLGG